MRVSESMQYSPTSNSQPTTCTSIHYARVDAQPLINNIRCVHDDGHTHRVSYTNVQWMDREHILVVCNRERVNEWHIWVYGVVDGELW
jgi:hypothetical protein